MWSLPYIPIHCNSVVTYHTTTLVISYFLFLPILVYDVEQEMRLVERTWQQLKDRVVNILGRLEEAASLSYQIKLEVGPQVLGGIFDKVAGLIDKTTSMDLSDKSTF